jgi:hypothetical protein
MESNPWFSERSKAQSQSLCLQFKGSGVVPWEAREAPKLGLGLDEWGEESPNKEVEHHSALFLHHFVKQHED